MECKKCKTEKLLNEFAPENVSNVCEHPTLICLRCVIKNVKESSLCPYPGCDQSANIKDQRLIWFQAILDDMFKEYAVDDDDDANEGASSNYPLISEGILTITLLTGESIALPYAPNMTVLQLKNKMNHELKIEVGKQKLLYGDKELTDYDKCNQMSKLVDFKVKPNSTLCLVVLMFSIPDTFNDVVFDLYWGYPLNRRDYLDASCLVYKGANFVTLCDYSHTKPFHAVNHSGDVMDDNKRIGHHTINVKLKDIPHDITHLFFTLSAYVSPNISRYPNPSLKFYEKSKPMKDLCKTTFHHAKSSQAVVMCSMSRGTHGKWEIYESGKLSAGNVNNYEPIKSTIKSLIMQGF